MACARGPGTGVCRRTCGALTRRPGHVLGRVEDDERAVVVRDRIVQVVLEQCPRLEAQIELHRQRGVAPSAGDDLGVVLLGGDGVLHRTVAAQHAGRHLAAQPEAPHQLLPRRVERRRQALAAVVRMHADIGAIEPIARRVVRGEPAALDDLAEGVADVLEVERQPDGGCGSDHLVAVQGHELPGGEQRHVPAVVTRLEALLVGEGRKAHPLQFLERVGVFRSGVHHDQAAVEATVVPAHGR
jgi:hypothetical protein